MLRWLIIAGTLPAIALAQPHYTSPQACIAKARDPAVPDPKRRADLADCLLNSRSYREAIRHLEAAGYVINSTISKKIELAETSGQRERAGKMLQELILQP